MVTVRTPGLNLGAAGPPEGEMDPAWPSSEDSSHTLGGQDLPPAPHHNLWGTPSLLLRPGGECLGLCPRGTLG